MGVEDEERWRERYRMLADAQLSSFVSKMLRPATQDARARRDVALVNICWKLVRDERVSRSGVGHSELSSHSGLLLYPARRR